MARFRNIAQNPSGVTAVEFGLIALPLFILLLLPLDLAYRAYLKSAVQGELQKAARMSSLGKYSNVEVNSSLINGIRLIAPNALFFRVRRSAYRDFSDIGIPEKIVSDTEPYGTYNIGDCYEDYNDNRRFDRDRGFGSSGWADDAVVLNVIVDYKSMFPLSRILGRGRTERLDISMVVQNQPYKDRRIFNPKIRCE